MRIAVLGSRGIPGNYGGFETFADQLATRLVNNGHEVTVYCCKPYSRSNEKTYKGVRRIILPTVKKKSAEKFIYALLSLFHVSFTKADVVLMLGVSAAPLCFIPRIFGKKVVINIDGLEWRRKKWGRIISWILKFSEKMAGVTANIVITDAKWIQRYYKNRYGKDSIYIAYGADTINYPSGENLKKFGLEPEQYMLYVSRFDPENNPLLVREAFDAIDNPTKKLVMVGDAPFANDYIKKVRETGNPNIIFTGYQYGNAYKELQSNAYCYIQATEVGGTHPALIEAMGAGNCVIANDVPEHREVLKGAGMYYKTKEELESMLGMLMGEASLVRERGKRSLKIIEYEYSWDKVVGDYEDVFHGLMF